MPVAGATSRLCFALNASLKNKATQGKAGTAKSS